MLVLLVPGVLMGGSPVGGAPAGVTHLLPLMGVGRAWWFILSLLGLQGVSNG
jgi:hypothetical protein